MVPRTCSAPAMVSGIATPAYLTRSPRNSWTFGASAANASLSPGVPVAPLTSTDAEATVALIATLRIVVAVASA